jgi:hypothetical protein
VAAPTVTDAVPVEDNITVCVAAVLTLTLPNDRLVALIPKVGVIAPSCKLKLSVTPPALAVNDTAAAELTEETVAEKLAAVAPAATVTVAGTVTALLLLASLTGNPPPAAATFRATVQLSVPVPVIDPLVQLSPVSTGVPVPLRLTAVDVPVEELLVSVNVPEAAPAAVGSNCTNSVAV